MLLIDTNIAVSLINGDAEIRSRFEVETREAMISVVTEIELRGGIQSQRVENGDEILAVLLAQLPILPLDSECAQHYASIVEAAGFSRRKVIDRMIAATALRYELPLATLNPRDFADVPALVVEAW